MMDDSRTVFCGNLSEHVTQELLYELFLQAAPLEQVKIPQDREGGRRANFAFVTFKHEVSVPYALELLNGIRLFDKSLNVKPRNGQNRNVQDNGVKRHEDMKGREQGNDHHRGGHNRNKEHYRGKQDRQKQNNNYGQRQYKKPYDRRHGGDNRRNHY